MTISKEHLDKFKKLYKDKFGEEITDAEALRQGTALVNLMKVVYRPLPKENEK